MTCVASFKSCELIRKLARSAASRFTSNRNRWFSTRNPIIPPCAANSSRAPTVRTGREEFAPQGGMIGFLVDNQRLRFEVNLDAAERANLRISSQLLKLATRVIRHEG